MITNTEQIKLAELKNMVLDHLPLRIFWKDLNSTYLGCNRLFAEDAGLDATSEVVGKTDFDFPWGSTEAKLYRSDDQEVMSHRKAKLNYEEPQCQESGEIWLRTSKIPLVDDEGQVVGVLGTYEDITERKQAEFELIELRKQAEAANRAKTEFLCRMSHDLRTPLNAILGNAQILSLVEHLEAQELTCLQEIQRSGEDLKELVSGILEMSQLEGGGTQLELETCNLFELLQRVLKQYTGPAKEKGLNLRLETDIDLPNSIRTDPMKFRRILGNLVGNGIKYTDTGDVKVAVRATEEILEIEVADTGIGIDQTELSTIFSPFAQVNGTTSKKDGVGLGLAICERFAEMLGGHIAVESKLGEGSRFRVFFPLGSPVHTTKSAPEKEVKSPPQEASDLAGVRVLIVDDHPPNRLLLQRFLNRVGMEVMEATNGAEAIECFESFKPQVILMDIRMPVMDGLEATRKLRDIVPGKPPSIIAVSGEAFEEVQGSAMEAGCDDYIVKPVCLKLLLATIERFTP